MAQTFKMFGIAVAVLIADAIICLGIDLLLLDLDVDEWWVVPLIVNVIGFVVAMAFLLGEMIVG